MTNRALLMSVAMLAVAVSSRAVAQQDPREVEARALFARGEYERSLEVFSTLFAERGEPIYLRNIGRSYQKLGRPERAIDAFKEYLRREKSVTPDERVEIEAFIKEMETLKEEQEVKRLTGSSARAMEPVATVSPPPVEARPALAPPRETEPPLAVATPPSHVDSEGIPSRPITKRWWFWTGVGAAVLAGTIGAIALSSGRGPSVPACPERGVCPR